MASAAKRFRVRFVCKGTGNRHALLLAAGEGVRHVGKLFCQTERIDDLRDISFIRIFPIQLSRKHNVFQHIEHGHQIVVLKNKADFPAAKYGQFLLFHCI